MPTYEFKIVPYLCGYEYLYSIVFTAVGGDGIHTGKSMNEAIV
jgi:hypothetical protein